MPRKPPEKFIKQLLTKDVLAAYGKENPHRLLADDLVISLQAVHSWGKFVPEQRVHHILAVKPELEAKVILRRVEYKLVTYKAARYVKVA